MLSDTQIRAAKPSDKPLRLYDERGLYLEITPSGGRWWRLKYRFGGKEKLLSMGTYPDTGLKAARDRRDRARELLAQGVDPSVARRAERDSQAQAATNSFEVVAREWHATVHAGQVSAGHAARTLTRLEQDVFPWLGALPIGDIKPPQLLQVVRRVEDRGAIETAHRALQACGQVFRYAIATGRAERDPTPDLRGALKPVLVQHMAAITDPQRVGELLRAIESYKGMPVTRAALQLAPLVFVRPGELRKAEWSEIDMGERQWRIPASRMKRTKQQKLDRPAGPARRRRLCRWHGRVPVATTNYAASPCGCAIAGRTPRPPARARSRASRPIGGRTWEINWVIDFERLASKLRRPPAP